MSRRAVPRRGLGATRTDIGQVDVDWIVMSDPDRNEFGVLRPRRAGSRRRREQATPSRWYGPLVTGDPKNPKSFGSRVARAVLWLMRGWKIETTSDVPDRTVMLAVPHTTNVDGLLLVLLTRSVGLDSSWMVKDVWLKPPLGWLIKRVGAIPVNRSKATGMVGQMVARFQDSERFQLMVPPEGTRGLTEEWKSGFYRIALEAGVPVTPTYLDYRRRRGGFLEPIDLTGDPVVDMDAIRAAYPKAKEMAKHPDKFGPIRLGAERD